MSGNAATVAAGSTQQAAGFEPDGRRRVVLTDDERRQLDRLIKMAKSHGFGVIIGCRGFDLKPGDVKPANYVKPCGGFLVPEEDGGYGCRCSRIHFRK